MPEPATPRWGPFDKAELTPERRDQIVEAFARAVVRRRLEAPAILFLELHRPLTTLASACVTFSQPTLGALFGFRRMTEWASLLDDRENIEILVRRIEELSNRAVSAPPPTPCPPVGRKPAPTSPTPEGP